ncbi:3-beta-hydroxysteroid dehydrogenase [Capsaspora owczarzaki ATCC 30864]|uniref:3-beta-hydroxysteroid dehydrogenase n=1 Tax=Capsaspora owczarzaki (strain ATCC 30864) TaxID=595528 RepID=A0A0D2X1Q0_CAPO3|nr:3-beta-hydroxysteroid dehydrogenase [Capsaspora owczarzaki ATCC 30864]KJE91194.1 3-beta-hydroxysteroid dehydrogenase [Capsaspora owczarzaki ATCC 30864]|eukprot:XP_004349109.1 3-beta-hydroxysteroid dehydrogenase [Capsaspora owczarzaki ATCC 30864]
MLSLTVAVAILVGAVLAWLGVQHRTRTIASRPRPPVTLAVLPRSVDAAGGPVDAREKAFLDGFASAGAEIVQVTPLLSTTSKSSTASRSTSTSTSTTGTAATTQCKRILITGGRGFVAAYVIRRYLKQQQQSSSENGLLHVHVLDLQLPDPTSTATDAIGQAVYQPSITYIRADITNKEQMKIATRGMDVVLHMASLLPSVGVSRDTFERVNVRGVETVLAACRENGVKALVYTSSATVLLDLHNKSIENADEDHPYPRQHIDDYTATKAAAERIVLKANTPSFATCILRPSAVFGLGDKVLLDMLVRGQTPVYLGKGNELLDYVHGDSVAQGHVLASERLAPGSKAAGQIYHICTGKPVMYRKFNGDGTGDKTLSHWGYKHPSSLPLPIATTMARLNEFVHSVTGSAPFGLALSLTAIDYTQRTYWFSVEKARRDLGYDPLDSLEALVSDVKTFQKTMLAA